MPYMTKRNAHCRSDKPSSSVKRANPLRQIKALNTARHEALAATPQTKAPRRCLRCGSTGTSRSKTDGLCLSSRSCAIRRAELDPETISFLGLIPLGHPSAAPLDKP